MSIISTLNYIKHNNSVNADINSKVSKLISIFKQNKLFKKYIYYIHFLHINPNSKPVLLFFLTISLGLVTLSSYSVINLLSFLKSKLLNAFKINFSSNSSNSKLSLTKFFNSGDTKKIRVINVPYKERYLKIKLDSLNNDKFEHDKLIFKKFMKEHELISKTKFTSSIMKFQFIEKIYIIWKLILIPTIFNKNSYILFMQILFLISRTWLTLLVTKLDGQLMKDLLNFNIKFFIRDLIYWFLFAVPASYVNSGIKYLTNRLSLNFRTNLIRYCHDLYMDNKLVYYKLQYNNNSNNSNYKLNYKNIDQYFTEDIKVFTNTLTSIFTDIGKPTIDLIFFAFYLRDNIGNFGIFGILLNYFLTGLFLKKISPNFNKIWKNKSFLEGIYYNYNLNLLNNCEEISFFKGINFEKMKIKEIFNKLIGQLSFEINEKFKFKILEDYILKFIWPTFGYLFAGLPILINPLENSSSSSNMKSFIVNKRLILSMADAGSRLLYSIKDISRLNGITDKIFLLLVNLHQVHDSNFQYGYNSANNNLLRFNGGFGSNYQLNSFSSKTKLLRSTTNNNFELGTIQRNFPGLRLEHINIIPPSIDGPFSKNYLIKDLNFKINKGQNLIIHGKNGCGKTSIVRLISELWPLYGDGLLSKPSNNNIFYVSQKQYFVSGSLRDQVTYPLNSKEVIERGIDDEFIKNILIECGLSYLLDRFDLSYNPNGENSNQIVEEIIINDKLYKMKESYIAGGIEDKKNWESLLSGGEKQKLIFARVLFHNKQFVIFDEPTSAISYDYEDLLFELMKKKSFTIITISNKESLIKYHDFILEINDNKLTTFNKIDENYLKKFKNINSEIEYLEAEISKIKELNVKKISLMKLLDGYE